MCKFLLQHAGSVIGMLSGWDRLRLRGTLRSIAYPDALGRFLSSTKRLLKGFGAFAEESSQKVRTASLAIAQQAGRPSRYLQNPGISKEQIARQIARQDGVKDGLICTLSAVEPCWSFALAKNPSNGHIELKNAYRKCLHVYQYYQHPVFGFMHVRLQSWLPFNLHVCINGREWLARQLESAGVESLRKENCFVWVADVTAAQKMLDEQVRFNWAAPLKSLTQNLSQPARLKNQRVRGLNLLADDDAKLLEVVGRGEHLINGMRNRDLQAALFTTPSDDPSEKRRRSGQVTRRLRMLRAHGLIRQVRHTHRYVVTDIGRQVITAVMAAREANVAKLASAA